MTIKVISTEATPTTPEAKADPVKADVSTESTQSAPEAKASEQNESTESETEENETEDQGSDQDEADEQEVEETEGKSDDSEKDKPRKKKSGYQRRIDRINAQKADIERERDYWRNLATSKKDAGEAKPEKVEPKQATSGEPDPSNFEDHKSYVKAVAAWTLAEDKKKDAQEQEKKRVTEAHDTLLKTYAERAKAFAEQHDDYMDVIQVAAKAPLPSTAEEAIISSELGPAIAYELSKNPKELDRICSMGLAAAAREIGKIEARLEAKALEAKKPEPKKTTNAPQPIAPVGSKGSTKEKSIYDADLTQAEYERLRMKQRSAS